MTQTANEIFKASGKGFQRTSSLIRKYGLAAIDALAEIEATHPGKRMRVYGKEAGGIGPAR